MNPTLTVGIAHFEDYAGTYMTINNLRCHWPELMPQVQFVVVDQSPDSNSSELLRGFLGDKGKGPASRGCHSVKYVPYTEKLGTSVSRDMIFKYADGDFVLVMACHVILHDLPHVFDLIKDNPKSSDIISGPIQFDSGNRATHFDPVWGAEMWGKWSTAWLDYDNKGLFCVRHNKEGLTTYHHLMLGLNLKNCIQRLPVCQFAGHESVLEQAGFTNTGYLDIKEMFEIPGQGLGCFLVKRVNWLGFNKHALGFGGEELYIHEKYRQAGHKALCSPKLVWTHRFGREHGVKYPLSQWNKVRNYVLEFNELGVELDQIHKHFVEESTFPEREWEELISDPINITHPTNQGVNPALKQSKKSCGTCGRKGKKNESATVSFTSIEEYFGVVSNTPRDINEHMQTLRELAAQCYSVMEISIRRESTTAFLTGMLDGEPEEKIKHFYSSNTEEDHVSFYFAEQQAARVKVEYSQHGPFAMSPYNKRVDLLFINWDHSKYTVAEILKLWAERVNRYIVLHNTGIYGEKSPTGQDGILKAVRPFMRENTEWSVIKHYNHQHGLTVLGRLPEDKPKLPGKLTLAKNFVKAVANHVASGVEDSETEELERRLSICSMCEHRNEDSCSVCGCNLESKARWKEQVCPIGKWVQ